MKNTIKILTLSSIIMIAFLLLLPNFSNAATTVNDEESLINAITSAGNGETITLQNNITITKPIVITKPLTINGAGFTLTGSSSWTSTSGNQTMITAQLSDAKLILKNIHLQNGPKYGIQAYNGGSITLDNVTITGFKYGGVLVNGGNIEVKNLHLGTNGTGANNGIEIDRGSGVDITPTLVMNGSLTSDSTENVVRVAESGNVPQFTINNVSNTANKVVVAGDKIVLTDSADNVIAESAIPGGVTVNSNEKKVVITLITNDTTKQITVNIGATITADFLKSQIELKDNYQIDGFYTDANYSTEFDFTSPLNTETTIYVKTSEVSLKAEKDETPKTGIENYTAIAVILVIVSTLGIATLIKKKG